MKLAYSEMTDRVYIVTKNNKKVDVTNEFLACIIGIYGNSTATIKVSNGQSYELAVKRIEKEEEPA